ncbi:hypothetical protein KIN20_035235 [Parelaphostrongylus tenuis]|uniref:Uncharacterized protein n=1 Tax=Parelaphostrongylus tenuis TaxID=148309 RepID=A0AAD5RB48_PARTN|nr:hypothetical protein KIN20_035235 [Parelaphostrongylus tenuis]
MQQDYFFFEKARHHKQPCCEAPHCESSSYSSQWRDCENIVLEENASRPRAPLKRPNRSNLSCESALLSSHFAVSRYPSRPPTPSLDQCVEIRSSQFGPNTAVPPSCSPSSGPLVVQNVPPVSSNAGFSES